jgi:hypothetical protein
LMMTCDRMPVSHTSLYETVSCTSTLFSYIFDSMFIFTLFLPHLLVLIICIVSTHFLSSHLMRI